MEFRTKIQVPKVSNEITYSSKIALLGSCFSEAISQRLAYHKFKLMSNPHGIMFSPKAIEKSIVDSVNKNVYTENDLVQNNEIWHSMHHHSSFSALAKEDVLVKINSEITMANSFLKEASHLVITLGTAWVYHYINHDELVANCHKIPQDNFVKRLLTVDEIKASLTNIKTLIASINPNCTIIFTLSPVRHIKDGFVQNAQSKAHLLTAIHKVVAANDNTFYFPSYEIMLDDLRDYRFYNTDMLHPNTVAEDYIWNKFKNSWFSEETLLISKKVAKLQADLAHRPFNKNTKSYKEFMANIARKKEALAQYGFDVLSW